MAFACLNPDKLLSADQLSVVLLSLFLARSSQGATLLKPKPVGTPQKKRICQQKLELEYLRVLAGKLESNLVQLRSSKSAASHETEAQRVKKALWKPIAERQRKERIRAEVENQKLRAAVKSQLKLVTRLQGLLRKRLKEEDVEKLVGPRRLLWVPRSWSLTDNDIFADQLSHVQRAHLEVGQLFSGPDFENTFSTFSNMHVVSDNSSDTGVAFVTRSNAVLPFDVKVTERGFWRVFAMESIAKTRYFNEKRMSTESVVANSYGLRFNAGDFCGDVLGKQTYRRYIADDYIVIMWKSIVEPGEINGTKFYGLRCHQKGWLKLRAVHLVNGVAGPMTSTALQTFSKMTVELCGDIADRDLQACAITDFIVSSHETTTKVYGGMINDVLVEEDWNLNGCAT
ncbi:hypothetical protein F443_16511 [Phytophthora nicotianae P1569]|uniref:START domain-containing protein n=1 Tax=Phytophthora nicotianae P1569 TaxID=1317065 RepID=V9EGA3_PHYNI|nr:hypothetical protein F443_16511 [Phytophthora nicotianae P1569]